jgi:hypothetical protein
MAKATGSLSDAIFWKRGPTYTFACLAVVLFVCCNLHRFWLILHLVLAGSVVVVGMKTSAGTQPWRFQDEWWWLNAAPAKVGSSGDGKGVDKSIAEVSGDDGGEWTGVKEATLKVAGRFLGADLAKAQAALMLIMFQVERLEVMIWWEHRDMHMGFDDMDGPVLAVGFILVNLSAALVHALVPLRLIASVAVLGTFSVAILNPVSYS